ncbi:hypothetical protein STCU_09994 [Strigomonas culicis]|uniref:Uncharacterized protein n=1 Tax=Strigomonas culicis TaxID=28005 RepID=S9TPJ9_9TRYP|nr:hypothetical protein STCU_09994 [Strigomonas culicis]|eukprot:EPY18383.1 hypothetical protein STCU_09994 [Strigomonas culicis]
MAEPRAAPGQKALQPPSVARPAPPAGEGGPAAGGAKEKPSAGGQAEPIRTYHFFAPRNVCQLIQELYPPHAEYTSPPSAEAAGDNDGSAPPPPPPPIPMVEVHPVVADDGRRRAARAVGAGAGPALHSERLRAALYPQPRAVPGLAQDVDERRQPRRGGGRRRGRRRPPRAAAASCRRTARSCPSRA